MSSFDQKLDRLQALIAQKQDSLITAEPDPWLETIHNLELHEPFDRVTFNKNDVIFRYGEKGDHAYVIEKGAVGIVHNKKIIKIVKEDDIFGEMFLFDDKPRSASAIAAKDGTVCIRVPAEVFIRIFQKANPVLKLLILRFVENIRETNQKFLQK